MNSAATDPKSMKTFGEFYPFYLSEHSPVQVLRDNRNTVNFVQSNSSIVTSAP